MENQVDLMLYRLKLLLFMRRLYSVFNVVKLTTILLQLKLKCKNKYTRLMVCITLNLAYSKEYVLVIRSTYSKHIIALLFQNFLYFSIIYDHMTVA